MFSSRNVGIRVRSQDAGKPIIYTIKRLADPASSKTFTLKKENREITVQNYYREQYNLDLKYSASSYFVCFSAVGKYHF